MPNSKLPERCAVRRPSDNYSVVVTRGKAGYYEPAIQFDVDAYNQRLGVTKAQQQAMLAGSMFGWDVPGANPDYWEGVEL